LPDEYVRFSKREGVATITIDRPQQMNAMTTEMWNKFRRIVEDAATDDEVRVVVLTGTGNAFCAGSDVRARLAARLAGQSYETTRGEMLEIGRAHV